MANINQHEAAVHDIANKVDHLITYNKNAGARFTRHIAKLYKMVEDYGQALQPYVEKLKRAEKRRKQNGTTDKTSAEFCPPPMGWIEINYGDNSFINVDMSVSCRPVKPVNPLLWFGIFGNAGIQRPPTRKEKLMCGYVLLAIVHDCELQFSGTPIDRRIFFADYKGKWFERHKFCEDVCMYYHYEYRSPDMLHHPATAQEKLSQLNRTLEYVQADLARKKLVETGQDTTRAKCWSIVKKITGWLFKKTSRLIGAIIVAIIGGLIVAVLIDIFGDFGWIERIKAFIYEIIQLN